MDYRNIFENMKNGILPPTDTVLDIFEQTSNILILENNVLELKGSFKVVGDIHGQYYDFLKMLEVHGEPCDSNKYIFLGDYVDRGFNSVEVFFSVLLLKLINPTSIYLLRGNHETRALTNHYTYRLECRLKYNDCVYLNSVELFTHLPVAAIVNNTVFCVHGGISPDLSVDFLKKSNRFEQFPIFNDIFWSDPGNVDYYAISPRGEGYIFGERATDEFLQRHGFTTIIRSHQLVKEGFESLFGGKVLTVWSAPNYSGQNKAICLQVDPKKITPLPLKEAVPQYKEDDVYKYFMDYKWKMFESQDFE
ncbi:Serine/threonine-protein phosphatase 4 catalytic subunit [Nosema granulosis]|uniref:Serine/threonine-protein phosphatase n=1 Tax=Nosema granulosis TaxID=83296 RepID=A0A9P6GZX8_9MICR|nr:Serine/threonine-protein phosphatase 4 catalytic subunit [Nosema granulosis]